MADLSALPEVNYMDVITNLTTFFTDKVMLKNYKSLMIENDLIAVDKIQENLSTEDWTLEVLNQIRHNGPDKFKLFVKMFRSNPSDEWIVREIEDVMERLRKKSKGNSICSIKPPNKNYVERKELEKECLERLKKDHVIALIGMVGCGKSSLARRVSHLLVEERIQNGGLADLPGKRIELDCSTEQAFDRALCSLQGSQLKRSEEMPTNLEILLNILNKEGLNIIIVDNVAFSSLVNDLMSELPENTYLIITSQDVHILEKLWCITVGGLTLDEACCLAQKVMKCPPTRDEVSELIALVNNVLGLSVAFKHMEISSTNPVQYIKYIKDWNIPRPLDVKKILGDYDKSLDKVLGVAFKEMREDLKPEESQNVEKVLNVLAYLHRSNIPVDDIGPVLDKEKHGRCIMDLVEALTRRSLAEVHNLENGNRLLNMNHIVQVMLHQSIKPDHLKRSALNDALTFLGQCCNKDTRFSSDFDTQVTLMPHVESALQHIREGPLKTQDPPIITSTWLFLSLGHIHTQQKRPEAAEKLLDIALENMEELLLDVEVNFHSLTNLGSVCEKICEILIRKTEQKEMKKDIENFVCSQRVPKETLNIWASHCLERRQSFDYKKEFFMTPSEYKRLSRRTDCVLPLDITKKIFLLEFLASLLYTSGRVNFYMNKTTDNDKVKSRQHLELAKRLCQYIENHYCYSHNDNEKPVRLLHTELVSRNGLLYFLLNDETYESAEKAKDEYEAMLNNPCMRYEFGLLKTRKDDPYRELACIRQLVKAFTIMLSSKEPNQLCEHARDNLEGDARKWLKQMERLVKQLERDGRSIHSKASYWNEAANLLINCRRNKENLREAEKYYLNACEIEQKSSSLNYPWWDAILGLTSLFKQGITDDRVLYDNLSIYMDYVQRITKDSPGGDYKKELSRVKQFWGDLRRDSKYRGLDRRRQFQLSRVVNGLQRSFSVDENDVADSDDAIDELGGIEMSAAVIGASPVSEENPIQENQDNGDVFEQEYPSQAEFGNVIQPETAEQCEQEKKILM